MNSDATTFYLDTMHPEIGYARRQRSQRRRIAIPRLREHSPEKICRIRTFVGHGIKTSIGKALEALQQR
jgi:hypothetical protein